MRAFLGLCGAGLTIVGVVLACGGSDSDDSGSCDTGTERCDCYPNGTCNDGLECLSNLCVASEVDAGVGGSAGAEGSGSGGSGVDSGGSNAGGSNGQGGSQGSGSGGSSQTTTAGGSQGNSGGSAGNGSGGSAGNGSGGSGGSDATSAGGSGTSTGGTSTGGTGGGSSDNLIKNGDFSQGKTYWDLTWQDGQLAAESYSAGEYCIENPSIEAYLSFTLGYPPTPSDAFPVDADASYTLSYRVVGYADLEFKIGQASSPYATLASVITSSGSTTYQTRTHTLVPDADETEAGLAINGTLYYYDIVCFDDISLVKD